MVRGLTMRGSVLGNLNLSGDAKGVQQELTVYVEVDNSIIAWLTKVFVAVIPGTIDAELSHGFDITGSVARWAWENRTDFCRWQASVFPPERTSRIAESIGCGSSR